MGTARFLFVLAVTALQGAGCAGCSEQCLGDNQGNETCPCGSDQDCATPPGAVLLCIEGACVVKQPPPAEPDPPLGSCKDGACPAGFACGIGEVCFAAASCQRIDVELTFRLEDRRVGGVTASRDDCAHSWSADAEGDGFAATLTIDLDGDITGEGCTSGHWFAADRVGELLCDEVTWALAPADVSTCLGDSCPESCNRLSAAVSVCP